MLWINIVLVGIHHSLSVSTPFLNNADDMHEESYDYAVIERIGCGLTPPLKGYIQYWYKTSNI
jgi:hypothetical protein